MILLVDPVATIRDPQASHVGARASIAHWKVARTWRRPAFVEAVDSILPGDRQLKLEIKAASVLTVDRIRAIANSVAPGTTVVVVADRISSAIRSDLNSAGVGWFDRRGHLRLVVDVYSSTPMFTRICVQTPPDRRVGLSSGVVRV
jgi:hypothetical protein